jgi:hypothetical protein
VHEERNCGAHHLPAGKTVASGKARASCLSGGETDRRSTTATVQGISPFSDDARILGTRRIESQHHSLSLANMEFNLVSTGAIGWTSSLCNEAFKMQGNGSSVIDTDDGQGDGVSGWRTQNMKLTARLFVPS